MSNVRIQIQTTETTKRDITLDIARGIAVLLMMLTHAIGFFHIGTDNLISTLGFVGGSISFIVFLFLSGSSHYLSYVRKDNLQGKYKALAFKALTIYLLYILIGFISLLPKLQFPPNAEWIQLLISLGTFNYLPPFAEFLIPFVILQIFIILFWRVYKFITNYPILNLGLGVVLFLLASFLFNVQVPDALINVKGIFVGNLDTHYFPVFQYFIVYLVGMQWGKFLYRRTTFKSRRQVSAFALIGLVMLYASATQAYAALKVPLLDYTLRFPPSASFILYGLIACIFIYALVVYTGVFRGFTNLQIFLNFCGINSLSFVGVHTVFLYLYQYLSSDRRYEQWWIVLGLYLILVLATLLGVVGWKAFINNLKGTEESSGSWMITEKVLVTGVWVMLAVIISMSFLQQRVNASTQAFDQNEIAFRKRLIREQTWPFWWDHSYSHFKQLEINNDSASTAARGEWVTIDFNHAELVASNKSMASGGDVRIVFYEEEQDKFLELPFNFAGINQGTSTIGFKIEQNLNVGTTTDKYFLYYGNNAAPQAPIINDSFTSTRKANQLAENSHKLSSKTNRKWILKEGSLQARSVLFTANLGPELTGEQIVTYKVVGTNLTGRMDNLGNNTFQANIDVSDLDTGAYRIQASASTPENRLLSSESNYSTFLVSYPLYVTWTQDWEGWDVPDSWLSAMNNLANKYGVPITHFFNPFIYVNPEISKDRAAQLTLWVQKRAKQYNDEIGLHLHMWWKMVEASGVTPRYEPQVSWMYGNGGGIKLTAYTTPEMKQMLNWSKRIFQENGLSVPLSFRAGGWWLDPKAVQALEETGFWLDSSGRAFPDDPRLRTDPPPWNLAKTQKPYKMNRNDLNSAAEPTFNLMQFPNNGADSTWYDERELTNRFDENYPNKGGIMSEPQVLTYLSHPQYYTIDEPRMDKTFGYIGQWLYNNDNGPVVYTTLENAYSAWNDILRKTNGI